MRIWPVGVHGIKTCWLKPRTWKWDQNSKVAAGQLNNSYIKNELKMNCQLFVDDYKFHLLLPLHFVRNIPSTAGVQHSMDNKVPSAYFYINLQILLSLDSKVLV